MANFDPPPTETSPGDAGPQHPGDVLRPYRRPHWMRSPWTSRQHQRDGHLTFVLYADNAVRTHLGHLEAVLRGITLKCYQYLEKVTFKFLP